MPGSIILKLRDPADYEKNVRGASVKEFVDARGTYEADLTRINLHRLWMQRGRKSLPSVSYTSVGSGRAGIVFLVDMNQRPVLNSGRVLQPGEIICYEPGTGHYLRTAAGYHAAAMSLSLEDFAASARALLGRELTVPAVTRVLRPATAAMARLMNLHTAAANLAANAADVLAHSEVAKAMEQELVRAMITCLSDGMEADSVRGTRLAVMRRFERALEAHDGEPLYLSDLCAEIGVSDRTLRLHCQEQLRMSPHRYLWLRRMNMVRRSLTRADATHTTVTSIAVEHGFGELGRFSVQYRKLFGEVPSATLHRPPDEPRSVHNQDFIDVGCAP